MEKEPCSYYEIEGLGVDSEANPCPALMKINVVFNEGTPEDTIRSIISKLIHIEPERIHIISEEQYLENIDEDDE